MKDDFKVLGTYLVSADAAGDAGTLLHGDAAWSDDGGIKLSGNGYAQVPAHHFQSDPFSFGVSVNPKAGHDKTMHIFSDWTRCWSFRLYLRPRDDEYQMVVILRRELNGNESMIANAVGRIKPDEWSCLAVSWDGFECLVYKNGELIADPKKRDAAFQHNEIRVQGNDHQYHEVGIKLDSKDDENVAYFVGQIKNLVIAQGSVVPTDELEALGCARKLEKGPFLRTVPYEPGMRNVMAVYLKRPDFVGDEKTQLQGDAIWADEGVILGDKGNVKVPAVNFQGGDFTIGIYVNPNGFRNRNMTVFSDWTKWWSFMFSLIPVEEDGSYKMQIILRRNVQQESDLVYLEGGVVKVNMWSYLSVSWNRQLGVCKLFVNGKVVATGEKSEAAGNEVDVQTSDREFYDVGMKGDQPDGVRFVGRLKALFILSIG